MCGFNFESISLVKNIYKIWKVFADFLSVYNLSENRKNQINIFWLKLNWLIILKRMSYKTKQKFYFFFKLWRPFCTVIQISSNMKKILFSCLIISYIFGNLLSLYILIREWTFVNRSFVKIVDIRTFKFTGKLFFKARKTYPEYRQISKFYLHTV